MSSYSISKQMSGFIPSRYSYKNDAVVNKDSGWILLGVICTIQIIFGGVFFFFTSTYLYNTLIYLGQLISGALIAIGVFGLLGGFLRNRSFLSLHVIGVFIGMILAFSLVQQIGRQQQVDCSLAHLFIRQTHLSETLEKLHDQEIFQHIYDKLNQVDDFLDSQQEYIKQHQILQHNQIKLYESDENQMKVKLYMVQKHAQNLIDEILNHPKYKDDTDQMWSERHKTYLYNKVQNCQKLIDRITLHQHAHDHMSGEEFEELLNELIFDSSDHLEEHGPIQHRETMDLSIIKSELPQFKEALDRRKYMTYHTQLVGQEGKEIQNKHHEHMARLHESRVATQLALERHQEIVAESRGKSILEHLPEHCVSEGRGKSVLQAVSFAIVILDAISAALAINLEFKANQITQKRQ